MTASWSTALGRRKHENAVEREEATQGQPLRRPAPGGGVDNRAGDVVVSGAHHPAQTTASVSTAPGQLKMACLRRAGRTAPARMTARMSTALGRQKHEITARREAGDGGEVDSRVGEAVVFGAHRSVRTTARRAQRRAGGRRLASGDQSAPPLRRPAHGGGVDSRVGDVAAHSSGVESRVGQVVVFGAHRPAQTTARVDTAPGRREQADSVASGGLSARPLSR